MNFLEKMRNALIRFMYGRNGFDPLNRFLFWVVLILDIASIFLARGESPLGGILSLVVTAAWLLLLFRTFSRNLAKRREENQKFVGWWWKVKNKTAGAKARHADRDHKYFTCKSCGAICRVLVGKGNIVITCPKCRAQIQAKT